MDQESVENNFSLSTESNRTSTSAIPGKFSWSGRTLVFTPNNNLDFNQTYSLKISTAATSKREERLGNTWQITQKTPKHSFLFIDTKTAQLKLHYPEDNKTIPLTDNSLTVKSFDYDPSLKRLIILATKDLSPETPIFLPYTINIENLTTNNSDYTLPSAEPISSFENNSKYLIHRTKFLPFEDSILVSRTKIVTKNGFTFPSEHEEDRELIRYDFDTNKTTQIRTGNALLYEFFPTPDGLNVLLIDDQGPLILHNLKSKEEELIANDFFDYYGFSEYGGYLLYSVLPGEGIFAWGNNLILQKNDGTKDLLLKNEDGLIDAPALSPDEQKIAFKYLPVSSQSQPVQSFFLALKDISNSNFNLLTSSSSGSIDQPQFAPDGQFISFLQFPPDTKSPSANYDPYKKEFTGANIKIYNLNTKEIITTALEGMDIEWIY